MAEISISPGTQTIARHLSNAEAIVAAAKAAGVELALACALVEKESGGRNIYGHDAGGMFSTNGRSVSIDGKHYPAGSDIPVTPENFATFYDFVVDGGEKSNGVGPLQITYRAYFPQARAEGYDLSQPLDNIKFGLRIIAGHLRGHSIAEAGTLYNAGNLRGGVTAYGRDLEAKTIAWRSRLTPSSDNPKEPPMAKIFISPSTQIDNPYATGSNKRNEMRKVRDLLVPMLEAAGHQVRSGDWTNNIASPVAAANRWKADLYVALHSNATGVKNSTRRGTETYVYALGGRAHDLAKAVHPELVRAVGAGDRGIRTARFYEVRETDMPAILTEADYHDSRDGSDWIKANHRAIAVAHARGICRYAGGLEALERHLAGGGAPAPAPAPKPAPAPTPAPTAGLYEILIAELNVRSGPGTNYKVVTTVRRGEVYTIVEKVNGWGKLKSGAGWIALSHTSADTSARKSDEAIAREVIAGQWGNGSERTRRLRAAGYNPATIQSIVNRLV